MDGEARLIVVAGEGELVDAWLLGGSVKQLSQEALTVLGSMTIAGNTAAIAAGQLSRPLYLEINKALEAIGGKWNRKLKAHVFDSDPEAELDQIVLTGGFTDKRQEFGFFETPVGIADQLVKLADVQEGHSVLEPSAGKGRLLDAVEQAAASLRGSNTVNCTAIEIQPKLRGALVGVRRTVLTGDFLSMRLDPVDRVVMNPPFGKQADIDHVTHAFSLLRPGGRLAAIMSAGVKFRQNAKTADFRCRVGMAKGQIIDLPEGAFAESGTNVRAVIVTMQKAA